MVDLGFSTVFLNCNYGFSYNNKSYRSCDYSFNHQCFSTGLSKEYFVSQQHHYSTVLLFYIIMRITIIPLWTLLRSTVVQQDKHWTNPNIKIFPPRCETFTLPNFKSKFWKTWINDCTANISVKCKYIIWLVFITKEQIYYLFMSFVEL